MNTNHDFPIRIISQTGKVSPNRNPQKDVKSKILSDQEVIQKLTKAINMSYRSQGHMPPSNIDALIKEIKLIRPTLEKDIRDKNGEQIKRYLMPIIEQAKRNLEATKKKKEKQNRNSRVNKRMGLWKAPGSKRKSKSKSKGLKSKTNKKKSKSKSKGRK